MACLILFKFAKFILNDDDVAVVVSVADDDDDIVCLQQGGKIIQHSPRLSACD